MNSRKKSQKTKRKKSADAPASDGEQPRAARKEVFDLADGSNIHDLMESNSPRVAKWAFQCVQKAARGRASLFEQKVALLMIQKSTPSTARKGDEAPEDLPEGVTKEELKALDRLIEDTRVTLGVTPPSPEGQRTRESRQDTNYKVTDKGTGE